MKENTVGHCVRVWKQLLNLLVDDIRIDNKQATVPSDYVAFNLLLLMK